MLRRPGGSARLADSRPEVAHADGHGRGEAKRHYPVRSLLKLRFSAFVSKVLGLCYGAHVRVHIVQ